MTSWPARRSTMATSTPASASSPANISPVGPPPATTTACSAIRHPHFRPEVQVAAGDSAARPGPCRKPLGARYTENGPYHRRRLGKRDLELFERGRQLPDRGERAPALHRQLILGHVFVVPGHLVRNVKRMRAQRHDRHDVRTQRVADHHEVLGLDATAVEHTAIRLDVLLAEDLDSEEHLTQP